MASVLVLLPLRGPGSGLTRLAGALSGPERARLASCMLADVVDALRGAGLERLVALTGDGDAEETARQLDLETRRDPGGRGDGLDAAVDAAVADAEPGTPVAVVMPDLPRLSAADVTRLLAVESSVVVAPTDDGGTGALLRRPGDVIGTAYGPGSARRHLRLARRAGLEPAVVRTGGLTRDVDTVEDLEDLTPEQVGPATAAFLTGTGAPTESI